MNHIKNPILIHIMKNIKIYPYYYWDPAYEIGPPKKYTGLVLWNSKRVDIRTRVILDLVIWNDEHIIITKETNYKILLADPELFDKIQKHVTQ